MDSIITPYKAGPRAAYVLPMPSVCNLSFLIKHHQCHLSVTAVTSGCFTRLKIFFDHQDQTNNRLTSIDRANILRCYPSNLVAGYGIRSDQQRPVMFKEMGKVCPWKFTLSCIQTKSSIEEYFNEKDPARAPTQTQF